MHTSNASGGAGILDWSTPEFDFTWFVHHSINLNVNTKRGNAYFNNSKPLEDKTFMQDNNFLVKFSFVLFIILFIISINFSCFLWHFFWIIL